MTRKPKNPLRFYRNEKWNNVCHHFVESISNAHTRHNYSSTLYRFVSFIATKYGAQRTPDKITKEDIEEFLRQPVQKNHRAGQPLSAFSSNAYLNAIRAFYNYCTHTLADFRGKKVPLMRRGQLPTDDIPLAATGDVDRDMTEDEVRAFFDAIDISTIRGKRDYALFWTLLCTGRRRAEITNLRRGDVEPFEFDGGRKGWRFHFRAKWRPTKEAAEMPPSVVAVLSDYHHAAGRDFATMPPEQPLFPGAGGTKPIVLNYVAPLFKRYARKAGITGNSVPHSLRWENAWQRFLANGNNLLRVQDEMGWKSIEQAAHYVRRRKKKNAGDLTAEAIAAKFSRL